MIPPTGTEVPPCSFSAGAQLLYFMQLVNSRRKAAWTVKTRGDGSPTYSVLVELLARLHSLRLKESFQWLQALRIAYLRHLCTALQSFQQLGLGRHSRRVDIGQTPTSRLQQLLRRLRHTQQMACLSAECSSRPQILELGHKLKRSPQVQHF